MKIEIEIDDGRINDALDAMRIGYWASEYHSPTYDRTRECFANSQNMGFVVERYEGVRVPITRSKMRAAIALMAMQYPAQFAALAAGRGDSTTGDLLIQLAAFGEERYA